MPSVPRSELRLPPPYSVRSPDDYLQSLVALVKQYQWIIDFHSMEFISDQHWDRLDPEWQSALLGNVDTLSDEKEYDKWFGQLMNMAAGSYFDESWPESLKDFVAKCHSLILERNVEESEKIDESDSCCEQLAAMLEKRMKVGMSRKKVHEVETLADLIQSVCEDRSVSHVMDIGSGQGYLSRVVAFHHGLDVVAVDMSEAQTQGAVKYDTRVLKQRPKKSNEKGQGKLVHVTEEVTVDNASEMMATHMNSCNHWALCGLHTCGDLATHVLRLFAENPQVSCVINVGCCYHYLSNNGYPLSKPVKQLELAMPTESLVLACQMPRRWAEMVKESRQTFRFHFHRNLLKDRGLVTADTYPVIAKYRKKRDFVSYAQGVIKTLNIPISIEEVERYHRELVKDNLDKKLIVLWTVRVLLAPVLESILLVDRWLYLKSVIGSGNKTLTSGVWMWPLFDPILSPRNMVIVASR